MVYRLLFLAAPLGIANAAESCYNCANVPPTSQFSGQSEQTAGQESTGQACYNRWINQDFTGQGCNDGNSFGGFPDNARQCGAYKCKTEKIWLKKNMPKIDDYSQNETVCWCTTDNCNKDIIFPADCGAKASEPENGADGKVGEVFSILLSAILATIF